ncbi:F-box protein [Raphanus sativus]|uniref:F-box protein At1g47340-like n=1 Tax=Raphanus sativus TaxID=3726 RepID=A0A6J0NVH7_RAPSA|nr:F-box protein At1g47340-like [Raphanus sativus]KAJ4896900.1 F-box protein [Raphanus sativus]
MVSECLPTDLITETLLRLPEKSIARFRSVSKQWTSIIDHPQFKHLYLTKSSSSYSRITFAIEEKGLWSIFSSPKHHREASSSSSSSLVVSPEFHMKFPPDNMCIFPRDHRQFACGDASGLIYFHSMWTNEYGYGGVSVVCNPKTGRYEALPFISRYRKSYSFFGFDPVGKQYKVLHMAYPCGPDDHRVMTLGARGARWRKVDCLLRLEHMSEGVCINGVLYCLGDTSECDEETLEEKSRFVIACFDVRSETFSFLYPESFCELINYNGKLGLVYYDDLSDDVVEFRVWVLEDAEKRGWSKHAYALRGDYKLFPRYVSVVGVICTGEIVLSMADYTSGQPFYVFYFNPEKDTIRRFEIQGFGEYHDTSNNSTRRVRVFVDDCSSFYSVAGRVEHLNVNGPTLLKSSIYAPYVYNEESEEEEEEYCVFGARFYGKKKRG